MVNTFTQNQIIRYTYHECSQTESQLIEECSQEDYDMKEEILLLKEARNFIPKDLFSAHPESLRRIMEYASRG